MSQNEALSTALTVKQTAAVAALMTSPSVAAAAKASGVSRATLTRWMATREFRRAYQEESRRLLEYSTGRIRAGVDKALDALERNMDSPAPPAVQVSAARAWLDHARACDTAELMRRLELLERFAKEWDSEAHADVA